MAEHADCERPVVLAGIGNELDWGAFLAECTIHLLRLAQWIGGVTFALNEHEWSFGVGCTGEGTLTPGVGNMLPRLAEVPAVVPGAALGSVFAELVDNGC